MSDHITQTLAELRDQRARLDTVIAALEQIAGPGMNGTQPKPKAKQTRATSAKQGGLVRCPDCGKEMDARGLGPHRSRKHGGKKNSLSRVASS